MPQHWPKSTVEVSAWCNTCGKMTPHRVSDGRLGGCKNEHLRPAQEKKPEDTQGKLF